MLLASATGTDEVEAYPLDRVRMQKGIFLVAMGGPAAWRELYDFSPYNWGPYSGTLAADLDALIASNLLRVAPVPGSRYGQYVPTFAGRSLAAEEWRSSLVQAERDFLLKVRNYVTSRSFNRLLEEVYRAYPEYATESRFRPWRSE